MFRDKSQDGFSDCRWSQFARFVCRMIIGDTVMAIGMFETCLVRWIDGNRRAGILAYGNYGWIISRLVSVQVQLP